MTSGNQEKKTLDVKKTKYTGASVRPTATDDEYFSEKRRRVLVSALPVSANPFMLSDTDETGRKIRGYSASDEEANESVRREMLRVGATEFNENASLGEIWYSIWHRVRGDKQQPVCMGNIAIIVVFAVVLCLVAASYSEYHATYREIKTMENEIEFYQAEQKKLKMAIEERDNFDLEMASYVTNVLGMVKEETLTKHYVPVEMSDTVSMRAEEERNSAAGGVLLSGFNSIISRMFPADEE